MVWVFGCWWSLADIVRLLVANIVLRELSLPWSFTHLGILMKTIVFKLHARGRHGIFLLLE